MPSRLDQISCVRMPLAALPLLASLRAEPAVRAALTEDHAWIRWDAGDDHVLQTVLPIHDAVLFGFHDGQWHRFGETLPAFDFPVHLEYRPLAHVLFPMPVVPIPAQAGVVQPLRLTLRRDEQPRKTTALLCGLAALSAWSDTVPAARLASLQGAYLNETALVLGDNLPLVPASKRFWGRDVLILSGYAPEPPLPESALKEASGLREDELLLWQPDQVEVIARARLTAVSRAAIRLAATG
jgi:hypothetical protein